jgi:AcrR family transcriptional regulator
MRTGLDVRQSPREASGATNRRRRFETLPPTEWNGFLLALAGRPEVRVDADMLGADMTMTPWGRSDRLRERMMASGPRATPEAAAQNQRERLFGAIVATCAERGYEATRVSDLVALSGVSRRDFYRHFSGKEACFVAAMETMLEMSRRAAGGARDGSGGGLETLIRLGATQPAGARFCLLESHAAGPEAVALMDAAVAQAEALLDAALKAMGEGRAVPREVSAAILGGAREVVESRLLDGREGELETLAPALREWAFGYRPPPTALPRPRPRPGSPGRYRPEDPAERIIEAMAALAAEQGYQATTIDQIVARAAVSLSTFYANFDGKQEVLIAALDAGQARLAGVALPPYRRARDWPGAVRAAFEAMFAFFAAEPDYSRMAMVEVYAAGGQALARRAQMVRGLQVFLGPGFERAPEVPAVVAETIGGATYTLVYRQIRDGGVEGLPALAPLATYLTLAPFLGAEEAAAAARGRR